MPFMPQEHDFLMVKVGSEVFNRRPRPAVLASRAWKLSNQVLFLIIVHYLRDIKVGLKTISESQESQYFRGVVSATGIYQIKK